MGCEAMRRWMSSSSERSSTANADRPGISRGALGDDLDRYGSSSVTRSLAWKTIPKEPWLRGEMVSYRPLSTTPSRELVAHTIHGWGFGGR